jgi:transposase-like protein
MSDDYQRIEVITGAARRRRWTTEEKLRIVEVTLRSGESISILARRHGVAPNLLYRWRRLMTEGGAVAVQADDAVIRIATSAIAMPSPTEPCSNCRRISVESMDIPTCAITTAL